MRDVLLEAWGWGYVWGTLCQRLQLTVFPGGKLSTQTVDLQDRTNTAMMVYRTQRPGGQGYQAWYMHRVP